MTLAFEPEPGMFIDTLDRFAQLDERLRHPLLQLTIDLGHVHCLGEGDIPALLSQWRTRVVNIHIEDMVAGVHEHLMFGQGTMDFSRFAGMSPNRLRERSSRRAQPPQPHGRGGGPGRGSIP